MGKWKKLTGSWCKTSREMQTRLIIYKVIHWLYWTPCKMKRLKLCETELCWRCDENRGTLLYMYKCEKILNVWENVILCHSSTKYLKFILEPRTMCLEVSYQQTLWCRLALITGCRIALRHWKTQIIIQFNEWLREINKITSYGQLMFRLNNKE